MSGSQFTYSTQTPVATYTVQATGVYDIVAYGASGGGAGQAGGYGAKVGGSFLLQQNAVLKVVVGGEGFNGSGDGVAGGGGGSFVIETFDGTSNVDIPLVIAGGGGGSGYNDAGGNAVLAPISAGAAGAPGSGTEGGGGGGYSGGGGSGFGLSASAGSGKGANAGSYAGGTSFYSGSGGYGGGGGGGYYGGGGGGGYGGGAGGQQLSTGNGGGGGGSLDADSNGSDPAFVEQVLPSSGTGEVTITPLCFLRGTRILTPTGEVAVEELQVGSPVITRFGGIQPVRWLGRHSHAAPAGIDPALTPVCIHAGALGENTPARDLYVSPGHSLLVGSALLLARLLVNGVTVTQERCPPRIDYIHIELAGHDCVIAEGAWAETYADAQASRAAFDNAADYDARYPDAGPAPDAFALCAPRPEAGRALEAALRPVLARALTRLPAPGPLLGPLLGSVDRVDGAWHIQGWAHDPAHPHLPVLLEVELGGEVLGQVAACEPRADLAQAGLGAGRCAFTFISPVRLRPDLLHTLRIRRTTDAATLPIDPRCAAGLPAHDQASHAEPKRAALRLVG